MLMDNHMCISFTLRQPINWLIKLVSSQYRLRLFFLSYSLDKQGSTTISLIGYPTNCWIKMEWVSSLYRVCTISICFSHAHVSSRVVPPYTFGKKQPILSLMVTLLVPIFSTSTSYIIYPLNSMSKYGFC